MTKESKQKYKCQYCGKEYSKESTLFAHSCEPKRRIQQKDETGVQLGLHAYNMFVDTMQGGAYAQKHITYEDFCTNQLYLAFVKYGRYCVGVRCLNFKSYTEWLLSTNKKIDNWCKDSTYEAWLLPYVRKESPQDALERALKEMQNYADEHPELKNGFSDYFRCANANRICHHISTSRISPWVVYNCASGIEFLDQLNEGQVSMIMKCIDPDFWQKKFRIYPSDAEWAKQVLEAAGL